MVVGPGDTSDASQDRGVGGDTSTEAWQDTSVPWPHARGGRRILTPALPWASLGELTTKRKENHDFLFFP